MSFLNNALKAKELFKKDKDYVVVNGEVLIVDEFTGRMLHGRRYNEGMHQAIEAKEGVQIQNENQTFATITLQNYFRLYDKLAGMTGTAQTEANEFMQIYKLGVVPIPTNRPMIRADETDVIYQTQQAKFDSVVEDIVERHEAGQPVLVGTVSVEKSEILSVMLKRRGVPHHVLNAKYHEQEATIIAQSGRLGAVTVATNMAGRGTDIMLGGNPEFIADAELHQRGLSPVDTPEDYEAAWPEAVAKAKAAVAAEHEEVVQAGGLYVLGTERHESRRIDNQLRGRSGRQGDPGKSRFYLSLEDDLMRMFNSERVGAIMDRLNIPADVPVENSVVSRAIRSAQTQVESQNFEIRKDVLKYDDVLNRQRTVIYGERHEVLEGADLHEQVRSMIDEVIASYVTAATADGYPEEWDLEKLWKAFKQLFPITLTIDEVIEEAGGEKGNLTADLLTEMVQENAQGAYDRREEEYTPELMRQIERLVVLSVLDQKWREHLYEMDYLREGIGLRAMAQRDPLVEYQREGFDMFNAMMDGIKEESVGNLFNRQFEIQENPIVEEVGAGAQLGFGGALPGVTAGQPPAAPAAAAPAAPAPAAAADARRPGSGPAAAAARAAERSRAGGAAGGLRQAARPGASRGADSRISGGRPAAGRSRSRSARGQRRPRPRHRGGPGRGGHPQRRSARSGRARRSVRPQPRSRAAAAAQAAGPQVVAPAGLEPRRPRQLQYSAPADGGGVETHGDASLDPYASVGRNDMCPCGSGRKFKRCHGGAGRSVAACGRELSPAGGSSAGRALGRLDVGAEPARPTRLADGAGLRARQLLPPAGPLLGLGQRQPHGQRPDPGADRHDEGHLDHVRGRLRRQHPLHPGALAVAEERQQPVQVDAAALGQPRQDLPDRPVAGQRLGQQHGELPRPGLAAVGRLARPGRPVAPSRGRRAWSACWPRELNRREAGQLAAHSAGGPHVGHRPSSCIADRSSARPGLAHRHGIVQGWAGAVPGSIVLAST